MSFKIWDCAIKGGTINEGHLVKGRIVHYVLFDPEDKQRNFGYYRNKAICGSQPGSKSHGWQRVDEEVTCKKCLNKIKNWL